MSRELESAANVVGADCPRNRSARISPPPDIEAGLPVILRYPKAWWYGPNIETAGRRGPLFRPRWKSKLRTYHILSIVCFILIVGAFVLGFNAVSVSLPPIRQHCKRPRFCVHSRLVLLMLVINLLHPHNPLPTHLLHHLHQRPIMFHPRNIISTP